MLTLFLALLMGLVGGALAGGLSRRYYVKRAARQPLDPALDAEIDGAARQWAASHGQPAAAPLVAGKLRLAYTLSQGRQRRRWKRSWR